ncbi:uncharacterized protein BDZ99DRAFT_76698 [Mytilinidion resinicola]|uniref:Uncharacterized protein n=1 Tax=Mytilinidion resinicola TaxID=574789 RepID=A0A6A6YES7_9PEZI|nr:uncharacterized protein BDZ99DRAFT_76698 [Mytilinidion resinicola]KAF2807240.1 hypothetical protein BDZ99DRAFT_76698 [Mytilinidion resinicola]
MTTFKPCSCLFNTTVRGSPATKWLVSQKESQIPPLRTQPRTILYNFRYATAQGILLLAQYHCRGEAQLPGSWSVRRKPNSHA